MKCNLPSFFRCHSDRAVPHGEARAEQPRTPVDTNTQVGHQDRYAGMRAAGNSNARRLSNRSAETSVLDLGFLIDAWVKSAPLLREPAHRVKYQQDASSVVRKHKHIDPSRGHILREWRAKRITADASDRTAQIEWEPDSRDERLVKAREILAYIDKPDALPRPELSPAMYQSLPGKIKDALNKADANDTHVRENLLVASEPATSGPVASGSRLSPPRDSSQRLEIAELLVQPDAPFSEPMELTAGRWSNSLGLTALDREQYSEDATERLQPLPEMPAAGPSTAYQADMQGTASNPVDEVLKAVPALDAWLKEGQSTGEHRETVVQRIASWYADSISASSAQTKNRPLKLNDLHFKNLPPLPPKVETLECMRSNLSTLPELTQLPVDLRKINFRHNVIKDIPESYFNERERDLTVTIEGANLNQQLRQRIDKHNDELIAADSHGVLFIVTS